VPVRAGEPSDAAFITAMAQLAARLYSRAGFVVAGKGRGPLGVAMVRELPWSRT
jgi:hypothetical protein